MKESSFRIPLFDEVHDDKHTKDIFGTRRRGKPEMPSSMIRLENLGVSLIKSGIPPRFEQEVRQPRRLSWLDVTLLWIRNVSKVKTAVN